MKVLLDSNVLFSGLGFIGNENKVIWLAVLGRIKLVVSDYILLESRKNIEKKFTGDRQKDALEVLERLIISEALQVKRKEKYLVHLEDARALINEKDSPILACAMLEDIDILITGDRSFHTKKVKDRIRVMGAGEFLERYTSA